MAQQLVVSEYAKRAVAQATVEHLEDGSYVAHSPGLVGVVAFGDSEYEAVLELAFTVMDWVRFSIERGQTPPPLGDIDFSDEETRKLVAYS